MNCYCCDSKGAKWNFKYGKNLCVPCAEALYRLEKYRKKISALSQAHYNQSLHFDHEHPAVSNGKSAKEIQKGYSDYLRAHRGR